MGHGRDTDVLDSLTAAFHRNTRPWPPAFVPRPSGWNQTTRQQLSQVITEANGYVQALNDQFADPGGAREAPPPPAAPPE